ncbi:membrane protein insertase YidC [Candidatus Azambacteria bacterium]|nr:membrane protein insertase YidC [Candidatus Azambacteria bacterium]
MSIGGLFHEIFTRPIFNVLIGLVGFIPGHDLGVAIVILTLAIRFVLYPISQKAARAQAALAALQPEIQAIQKANEQNREAQAKALMAFYKEKGINPASGCLPMLIQLPILLALYQAFLQGVDPSRLNGLYAFIPHPGTVSPVFLGLIDLSARSIPLALLTGAAQFWQSWMVRPRATSGGNAAAALSTQMTYILPVVTAFIAFSLPAALPLYWFITTLFSIAQQYLAKRSLTKAI